MKNDMENETKLIPEVNKFLDEYTTHLLTVRQGYTPIHVDDISSKIAKFYEVIRKVVDWKDDASLRRGAIERILKRILFPKISGLASQFISSDALAQIVTVELIRGGHLPNDSVPQEKVIETGEALHKYIYMLANLNNHRVLQVKGRLNYINFILEIAACEIEEILVNPFKEYGLVYLMASLLDQRLKLSPVNQLSPNEKQKWLYIAICITLYGLDDNFIFFQLLKNKYPDWHMPKEENLKIINSELFPTWKNMEIELQNQTLRKFTRLTERLDTVFILIDDILTSIKDKPREILPLFQNKEEFTKKLEEAYQKRYSTLKTRLFRLAIFSTLSVFLSNWVTFFIVEVPMASIFYEGFNLMSTIADFAIPSIVMFILVIIIRPPGKSNEKKAIETSLGFVYQDEKKELYQIKLVEGKQSIFRPIMTAVYFFLMFVVFGVTAFMFKIAKVPMTSVIFDTFTIALTVFAAVTIRNRAMELNVDDRINVSDFLLDIFSVPVAKIGSILAQKWKEYNIVSIFFNFIIETPFALLLDFIGRWSEYIKERRVEIH
jgi:hypothetical protein